ncbi:MAG: hypothetical protein RLZZ303_287 [Candidatus Hydrogenedentota bacterium]|jgi:purine-nucleoside phosphorylase
MLAVVAGSGIDLTPLFHKVCWQRQFREFAGLRDSTVAGHASSYSMGMVKTPDGGEQELLLQSGRRHVYEGCAFGDIARTVDVLRGLGATRVLFTNAAGSLKQELRVGSLVAVRRILNWPCRALRLPVELDASLAVSGADAEGTYAFLHGPCYETPSEIAALRSLGVDLVGMSTAPECLRCQQVGLPAGAVSVVTNVCGAGHLGHAEVVAHARAASVRLMSLIRANVGQVPEAPLDSL